MNRFLGFPLLSVSLVALVTAFAAGCAVAPASSSSSVEALDVGAVVQVVDTTAGKVLADAQGLSLYTYDHDTSTTSTCYHGCATAWPPLVVPADQELTAPFALTPRTDGTKQVMSSGHPLYRYAGDAAQGDITGDGLGGIWHLARPAAPTPPPAPTSTATP